MMRYVFGIHAVESLLRRNPQSILRLCLQEGRSDKRIAALETLARNQGVLMERMPRSQLDTLIEGRHQGAVAEASQTEGGSTNVISEAELLERLAVSTHSILLLVLDGVTDPHNLGACLRSADAAGVDAVIVPKDKSAGLTPTALKVACGAGEVVPFVQVTNLSRTLQAIKALGVWLYGTDGDSENTIYDNDLTSSAAIVMGAEGQGMRRLTREQCDILMALPMSGSVSSLNVSVATGICLFEARRQRLRSTGV